MEDIAQRLRLIQLLFGMMDGKNASNYQIGLVATFRRSYPNLNDDLDFCFEVLAGKHKLGFALYNTEYKVEQADLPPTIRDVHNLLSFLTSSDKSEYTIQVVMNKLPSWSREFFIKLFNREYRLGYTNRGNMVTDKHCMLAKSYPEGVKVAKEYYIQEKLNGNRCIAYYNFDKDKWEYISRSQKPMNVEFDMSGLDINLTYDGEIMSAGKLLNKHFHATSGIINSKDKPSTKSLMYYIYDILDASMPYKRRRKVLREMSNMVSSNVAILKVLDKVMVSTEPGLNIELDEWLDKIVAKGGEGIMLRDPDAPYHHSKHSGDRPNYLLKYKKTKTADLRIVGWNEGKGKYEGLIGSFICEDDDKTVRVNVAGMTDAIRLSNPDSWIGKIIEVAYFEGSKSKTKSIASLQFPRMKGVRHDKTETSLY